MSNKSSDTSARDSQQVPEERLPAVNVAAGAAMCIVLIAGLAMTVLNPGATEFPEDADFITGEWTTRYQTNYEDGLLIQEPATYLWSTALYAAFGQGRDGVLVGEDGWLFTTEEFAYYPGEEERIERWIEYVGAVDDLLAERGIELVVALVPAKARLYPGYLGRYEYPDYAQARDDRFREGVLELGVPVPDLAAEFEASPDGEELFLRTDTHWSPTGTLAAARALAPSVIAALEERESSRIRFEASRGEPVVHEGDLLTFLPLGPFSDELGPEEEQVRTLEVTEASDVDESTGLFEEVSIPITLVGTSYSAGELWNFAGALKNVMDADVLNVATKGEGPFVPMAEWLESDAIDETTPDVVIWEIPERYLPVEYEIEAPGEE